MILLVFKMDFVLFSLSVIGITATGALAPGPLSVATLALGVRGGWRSGFLVAVGHTVFELPYVLILALLLGNVSTFIAGPEVKLPLSLITAAFTAFFAYLLVNDALKVRNGYYVGNASSSVVMRLRNPVLVGLMLTGLNPFFLIWWATVGLPLIENSLKLGLITGIPLMYALHVWMDFAWLTFLAYTSSTGAKYLGFKGYKALLLALALMLIIFAIHIVTVTLFNIALIPF